MVKMRSDVWLFLLFCLSAAAALTPLTEIKPSPIELNAFAATVLGALGRLQLTASKPVIHLLGASDVEAAVDWSPLCEIGATLVMVGPKTMSRVQDDCVLTVKGLYSTQLMESAMQPPTRFGSSASDPDVFILLNADLYTCVWRRTLAQLLQRGKPIVLSMYCMYEGAEMERMLKLAQWEFSAQKIAQCDREVSQYFPAASDMHHQSSVGSVPLARFLWGFQSNPHAHEPPRDCYSNTQHGVRNSYWMAFTGAPAPKSEL